MEVNPLGLLNDFLNRPSKSKPCSYSDSRLQTGPRSRSYIDSIVNDNNFITTYSKTHHLKKLAKRNQAVELIQGWFKKMKCRVKIAQTPNEAKEIESCSLENSMREQAARKIQQFFKQKIQSVQAKTSKVTAKNSEEIIMGSVFASKSRFQQFHNVQDNKNNSKKHNYEIKRPSELIRNLLFTNQTADTELETIDYRSFDEIIMKKTANYFYFKSQRLDDQNKGLKSTMQAEFKQRIMEEKSGLTNIVAEYQGFIQKLLKEKREMALINESLQQRLLAAKGSSESRPKEMKEKNYTSLRNK